MKRILSSVLAILLLCGCAVRQPEETEPSSDPAAPSTVGTTAEPVETTVPTQPQTPQAVSILDFLRIAARPVGSTMYVWGGGWNEEDTGAGVEAVTLGLSPRWAEFAGLQDASYDYRNTRYQIHDGLDCSGYVGWAVYNVMEKENGAEGFVCSSTQMAQSLADRGFGTYIPAEEMTEWLPGDVMSMQGHCWIVVGMCDDGSVLLVHSSPPGVRFCGTKLADGSDSQAVALAEKVMQERYPEWYERYPDCGSSAAYLEKSSAMRWSEDVLSDSEGVRQMQPEAVLDAIFAP